MHIYHSALALAPKSSTVLKNYGRHVNPLAEIVFGTPNTWDSSIATATQPTKILTAAWSPCNTYIATVLEKSTTIEVLDPVTLTKHSTINSPLDGAKLVTFSPDSRLLLCCGLSTDSLTNFVASWVVQTGHMVGEEVCEMQVKGHPSAITSSPDGSMVGVAYVHHSTSATFTVCIYKVDSGRCVFSHLFDGLFAGTWSYHQSLRFSSIKSEGIIIWEVPFILECSHKKLETLHVSKDLQLSEPFILFPTLPQLAYIIDGCIFILDVQSFKFLLETEAMNFRGSTMSFSSDGHYFACGTTGPDIYLWEDTPAGYRLHQRFSSNTRSPVPLFSPDGASIFASDSTVIQLWPTGGPSTLASQGSPHNASCSEHFIIDLLPDKDLVAFARGKSNTVEVLYLKPSIQRLVIDTGMEVRGLKIVDSTIVVEGPERFDIWTIPAADSVPGAVPRVENSTTKRCTFPRPMSPQSSSFPSDCSRIAVREPAIGATGPMGLSVYNVLTGDNLATTLAAGDMVWFSQDGSQVWCDGEVGKEQGWQVKDNGPIKVDLDPLPIGSPPEGYPWRSSRGFTVTDDGEILDFEGERRLLLPSRWRSYERKTRVWSGPYLALLHNTLPEPVILKLEM